MTLDLETFLTTLYVLVDDLYKQCVVPKMPDRGGPEGKLSDSEVLCLGLAAQWRRGVPWHSERSFVRYALAHLRPLFPGMTSQSAFNRRLRRLWGACILLSQKVAEQLGSPDECEIMDCAPVPIARGARSFHPGWLADIARVGKGGNERYFYGLHLLLVVSASSVATGWTLAAGNVQDRWLAELLLSSRAGTPQLSGPSLTDGSRCLPAPSDWVGPVQSSGSRTGMPILADLGYGGADWQQHWREDYDARVLTPPECERHLARRWFSSLRQAIETAFASLCECFALHFPQAHTRWGLLTRIAAKIAAYNLGIFINRLTGRPDLALPTLIG
jgi:hypothetical protein